MTACVDKACKETEYHSTYTSTYTNFFRASRKSHATIKAGSREATGDTSGGVQNLDQGQTLPHDLFQLTQPNVSEIKPRAMVLQTKISGCAVDARMCFEVCLLVIQIGVANFGTVERNFYLPAFAQDF